MADPPSPVAAAAAAAAAAQWNVIDVVPSHSTVTLSVADGPTAPNIVQLDACSLQAYHHHQNANIELHHQHSEPAQIICTSNIGTILHEMQTITTADDGLTGTGTTTTFLLPLQPAATQVALDECSAFAHQAIKIEVLVPAPADQEDLQPLSQSTVIESTFASITPAPRKRALKLAGEKPTTPTAPPPPAAPATCPQCGITLKNSKNLRSHLQTHGGAKNFHCTLCPKSFLRSNQLKSHQKVHTGERPYECSICLKTFSQSSNFLVHKNTHLDLPVDRTLPYRCTVCQRSFAQQLYLKAHMRVHTDRDPMRCRLCRRKYDHVNDLETHQREHVAANRFRCLVCGKEFERYINLKNHRFTHNGLKPYACKVCGKPFAHTTSLAVHMRTHTGEKPYECPHCAGKFSQWANYHRHLGTHTRDRPVHECAVCGQRFGKSSSLKSHARTHQHEAAATATAAARTELPDEGHAAAQDEDHVERRSRRVHRLKCEICGGRFKSVRQIRAHMEEEHSGGGQLRAEQETAKTTTTTLLKCDECDVWADELALEVHVRDAHVAYMRHGCPHCRLDFAHTDMLLAHLKEHLGQKQCEQCGKMFRKFGLYKRHQCIRAAYMQEMGEREREERRRLELRRAMEMEGAAKEVRSDDGEMNEPLISLKQSAGPEVRVDLNGEEVFYEDILYVPCVQDDGSEAVIMVDESTKCQVDMQRLTDLKVEQVFEEVLEDKLNLEEEDYQNTTDSDEPSDDEPQTSNTTPPPSAETDSTTSYTCPACPRRYTTAKGLHFHLPTHGERRFRCDQCAQSFVRSSELKSHLRSHTGERPYQCEICSKCFTQSSALYTHLRVHTGERPYACTICPKRFKQSSACKRHEALHTGEKPYMCPRCGKAFANADGLQIHMRSHDRPPREKRQPRARSIRAPRPIRPSDQRRRSGASAAATAAAAAGDADDPSAPALGANGYYGDLPYPCEVCRKTFAKACTLWVHAKIHTGEKNHRCDQCPKAFAQAANLKRHKLSHSGRRPHQCFECTKWFARRETLDAHMELHRAQERESAITVVQVSGVQPTMTAIVVNAKVGAIGAAGAD